MIFLISSYKLGLLLNTTTFSHINSFSMAQEHFKKKKKKNNLQDQRFNI